MLQIRTCKLEEINYEIVVNWSCKNPASMAHLTGLEGTIKAANYLVGVNWMELLNVGVSVLQDWRGRYKLD